MDNNKLTTRMKYVALMNDNNLPSDIEIFTYYTDWIGKGHWETVVSNRGISTPLSN